MQQSGPAADIRHATDGDVDRIVGLTWDVAAEGEWIGTEVPFDRQERKHRVAGLLAGPASTILVADASRGGGPTVVGEITVNVAPYGVAEVAMMVAAPWRGRGIGRALLDRAAAWARQAGAHKLWLEVWPHNTAALGLYRQFGFVEEGRKRRHYQRRNGELWDAVLMGLPLRADDS
jgi:ribosomal protein S18 acetylase RimI-like enzyme